MRIRILIIAATAVTVIGAGRLVARGAAIDMCCVEQHECCDGTTPACCPPHASAKQWSIANFLDPIMVNRTLVQGPVIVVHDDEKMARGEPCTTFYRFDPAEGQKEALVSFHCKPRRVKAVSSTTFTTATTDLGIKRLIEYQIAGDSEAHGVPR